MATREPIYAALASLVFNDPGVSGLFVTTGRKLRHHAQLPGGAASCPALFIVQDGEDWQRIGKGIDVKRTLRCSFILYFWNADIPTEVPATQCNNGLDAIDAALNTNRGPANTQTLGGLVEHVYTEGAAIVDEGLLQEFSVVRVPVTILIP